MESIHVHQVYQQIRRLGSSEEEDKQQQQEDAKQPNAPAKQTLSWQDSILVVLVHLRTGSDTTDLFPYFGVSYSTLRKHYLVYQQALRFFMMTEMPYPSIERILASAPPAIRKHHPTLESSIDMHEQGCETGSSLPVANTFFSKYKAKHTIKLFGAITPCGFGLPVDTLDRPLDEAEPRPGRCTDPDLIEQLRWPERVAAGYSTMADKGILVHSQFAAHKHTLLTPFKKKKNVPGFNETAMLATEGTARVRIHVERFFERVQDFKFLRNKVKVSEMDIFSSKWSIAYRLCNYDADLIRQGPTQ